MARPVKLHGVSYRSRVEAEWGIYLKSLGYVIEHEPFYVDGRSKSSGGAPSYLPDFLVPTGGFEPLTGVIVEVKRGKVTDKDLAKWSHLMKRLEAARDELSGGVSSTTVTSGTTTESTTTTFVRFVAVEGPPPGQWHFAPSSSGECENRRIADVWSYGPPPTELLNSDRQIATKARQYVADHGTDTKPMPQSSTACELSLWRSKLVAS